jgi:hypothetical protein
MKKFLWLTIFLTGISVQIGALAAASAPVAHADYFSYPCQPPGVGTGVQVHVIIDASGQFCDGPTEINLSHYHCESGGGGINGGAIGLGPSIGPLTLGGFGGSGFGGGGEGCSWRCPDNTLAPAPNPPGIGSREYIDVRAVIKRNKAFCVTQGHLIAAGPTSELVNPDEGYPPNNNPEPYQQGDPNVPVPVGIRPPGPHQDVPDPQQTDGNIPIPSVPVPGLPPVIPPVPQLPGIPGIPLPGQG